LPEEEEKSSNYKELTNLGDMVSEEAMARRLKDCKLFVFTEISQQKGFSTGGTFRHPIFKPLFWICKL
jgi:hypothetical protein